jgi:outer membrane protein TolC
MAIAVPTAGIAAGRQVTLPEAIGIALENNHEMRATRSALLARKADIGIARGPLLPQVGLEQRLARTNNPPGAFMAKLNEQRFTQADFAIESLNNPSPITDYQTMATVDQAVFTGKALLGLSMARGEYSAQREDYARKKEETALAVARAYLAVKTARGYMAAARSGVADAAEHVRIAQARYKNGLGLYSDTLRAKTAAIEAEQRVVTADKNLSLARRTLGLLLGDAEPPDIAPGPDPELPLREMAYYQDGAASRRDVKALEIRRENAKTGIRLAESGYLPTLGIRASYQMNDHRRIFGNEGESWWLMGVLRWDLFDGAGREYERIKAVHKQAETEECLKGLREMVSFGIAEGHLAAQEAQKNLELSRAALASAEEGRKLVESRFANSLSPLVDLLDVQIQVDHSRANVVARENEYRLALIRLSYESGTILRDLGVE